VLTHVINYFSRALTR